MKRAIALILVLVEIVTCLLFAYSITNRLQGEEESYATNVSVGRRIVTDKTVYVEGEPIMVTAWSPNPTDLVSIGIVGDRPDRIRTQYVGPNPGLVNPAQDGNGSGTTFDIRQSYVLNSDYAREYQDLPAGRYVIYMMPNSLDKDNIYCFVEITIVPAQE